MFFSRVWVCVCVFCLKQRFDQHMEHYPSSCLEDMCAQMLAKNRRGSLRHPVRDVSVRSSFSRFYFMFKRTTIKQSTEPFDFAHLLRLLAKESRPLRTPIPIFSFSIFSECNESGELFWCCCCLWCLLIKKKDEICLPGWRHATTLKRERRWVNETNMKWQKRELKPIYISTPNEKQDGYNSLAEQIGTVISIRMGTI